MGCAVYANGMSIACKVADGKSIAAMPDVCFTPPLTPATPPGVPIPYPNTGMASDTTDGSQTVQIGAERQVSGSERSQPREIWKWFALAALLLLLLEWYIYNRRIYV